MKILFDQWTYLECMSDRQTDILNSKTALLLIKIVFDQLRNKTFNLFCQFQKSNFI